jgi:hypothetical protein
MLHLGGHYYYVYNRGCNRQPIFANDGNYVFLTFARVSKSRYCAFQPITL